MVLDSYVGLMQTFFLLLLIIIPVIITVTIIILIGWFNNLIIIITIVINMQKATWQCSDILATSWRHYQGREIKMQVQKELKYSKFAWMKTVKDHTDAIPEDLLSCFRVLKKCKNKFNCLVNEILYIKQLTPSLPHHIIPTNWWPYWIINKIQVWWKNNNYISCKYHVQVMINSTWLLL